MKTASMSQRLAVALAVTLAGAGFCAYAATVYYQPTLTTSRFAGPVIRTGNGPASILVTDMNGDGTADLVIAAEASNAIGIQPGKGDGRYDFLQYKEFPAGNSPIALALGDFNGDGNQDLVEVAQADNAIDVFLANGDGSFAPRNEYVVGKKPSAIATADLNGDGITDIVVSNAGSNSVSVLIGKSDGTFDSAQNFSVGTNPAGIAVIMSDAGKATAIVTANKADNSISVLKNNGDGSLGASVSYSAGAGPSSVAAADVNGDKQADLVVANQGDSTVSVLLGESDGTFGTPTELDNAQSPTRVALTDQDGDGNVDIITAGATGEVTVFRGNGDGSFRPPTSYAAGTNLSDLAVADANGDGRKDVVVANDGGINGNGDSIAFLFANADGTLQARTDYDLSDIVFASGIAAGDLNGDDKPDLAVVYGPTSGGSILQVWLNGGDGTFSLAQSIPISTGAEKVYIADVTGDDKADLVAVGGYSDIHIYVGDGAGSFTAGQHIKTGVGPVAAAIADFNGDGSLDIATANTNEGTISIHLGAGDGTFDAQPYRTFAAGGGVSDVKAADFNKDGKLDLVAADYSDNAASVLLGNGDGTFQTATKYSSDSESLPQTIAVADFNADGNSDFAVAYVGTNTVEIFLGKGDGSFEKPVFYSIWWAGPTGLLARDIDGDGDADLLMADDASDTVTVLYGAGDGTFNGEAEVAVDGLPSVITVANFNGDDRLDMAVATGSGFSVVPGVDRPPETDGGSFTMKEGASLSAKLTAKDPDPDDTVLAFNMLKQPPHGKVTLASDGAFTYTPNSDFQGKDQFTYNVSDKHTSSGDGVVEIHVESTSDPSPAPGPSPSPKPVASSSGGGGGATGPMMFVWILLAVGCRRRYFRLDRRAD